MSEYIDIKEKINKIENNLKNTDYKYGNFFEIKYRNFREVISYLNDDEVIYIINKTNHDGFIITVLSKKYVNIFGRSEYLLEDVKQLSNYTNLNYYPLSVRSNFIDFPYEASNNIYESLYFDTVNEKNDNKIKHIIFLSNDDLTTFPYWLLLTQKENNFSLKNIKEYSWFSKKFSYSIIPSLNFFVLNRKKQKWILGIEFDSDKMNILQIVSNSNADKYDFRINDKIKKINNMPVSNATSFIEVFQKIPLSNDLEIELLRNNKTVIKKLKGTKKKSANPLLLPDKIVKKLFGAKKYDFVGIGDPVLSANFNVSNVSKDQINQSFADYQSRGIGISSSLKQLPSLPETKDELLDIQRNFEKKKTLLFMGKEANEINIKKANLTNAKFIVFATHALTNGEIDEFNEPGIVLTPPKKGSINNDGLLTASEIMNLDLNNTKLVVLSACNSSSGKTVDSVALSGLAKSFFVAGTESLIVSGWPVESESAAYLSSNTFKILMSNDNTSYARALQMTINKMIDKNMDPLFWSPFMLVGNGY